MANKDGTKSGGRKKGTANKKSLKVLEVLAELDYDPLREAVKMLQIEPKSDEEIKSLYEAYINKCRDEGMEVEDCDCFTEFKGKIKASELPPDKRLDGHIKLIKYIYPARKAIEVSTQDDKQAPIFTIHMGNKNPSEEGK